MATKLTGGNVYYKGEFIKSDLLIHNGKVFVLNQSSDSELSINSIKNETANSLSISSSKMADDDLSSNSSLTNIVINKNINCDGKLIIPGFTDVHVHFREPGFSYKETIATGSLAGAAGGYTQVCTMPNLNPAPSNLKSLNKQLDIIKKDSVINIVPYGTITSKGDGRSTLAAMEEMAHYVCGFTDDGKGIQTGNLMEDAMIVAKKVNKLIVAHCEDESLLGGTAIHDGEYAKKLGVRGISSESEWKQVERDVALAEKTGCGYHVCHISTKETVDIIRNAKKRGVNVTCETAPHYLVMCDENLQDEGRFKMNPPIRSKSDQESLLEGIVDGTIDMIATDHAPHSEGEKSRGILKSAFGIVGLETAFPILYTKLVKTGVISLEKLIDLMAFTPCKRFNLKGGKIETGEIANLTVIDLNKDYIIEPSTFKSKGKATPFAKEKVFGEIQLTICNGEICYER